MSARLESVPSQAVAAFPYLIAGRMAQDLNLASLGLALFVVAALLGLFRRHAARRPNGRMGAQRAPER